MKPNLSSRFLIAGALAPLTWSLAIGINLKILRSFLAATPVVRPGCATTLTVAANAYAGAGSSAASVWNCRRGFSRFTALRRNVWLAAIVSGFVLLNGLMPRAFGQGTRVDVTAPGDLIIVNHGSSPGGQDVSRCIDNSTNSKYLNFDGAGSGLKVTPAFGPSIVTGITVTSADDVPARDPASFILYGRNDAGGEYTRIASGAIPAFSGRRVKQTFNFSNLGIFQHYELVFPTLQGPVVNPGDDYFQVAEIELLGTGVTRVHDFAAWDAFVLSKFPAGSPGGFAYLAVADGEVKAAGTGGFARAPGEAVSPGVRWTLPSPNQIASSSKPITATALVKLWELRNKNFSFDDPFWDFVQARLPVVSPSVKTITLRNLLQHTSGLQMNYQPFTNPTDFEGSLSNLVVTPGPYLYNNANFYLLQLVIESLSGTSLETFVRTNLLDPACALTMSSRATAPAPVLCYSASNPSQLGFLFDLAVWPASAAWASTTVGYGGWFASVNDLSALLVSLRQARTLSPDSVQMMFSEQLSWIPVTVSGTNVGYFHNGAYGITQGQCRSVVIHFNDGLDVTMLANSDAFEGFNPTGYGGLYSVMTEAWKIQVPLGTNPVTVVTSLNDSGAGSLRDAITQANAAAGADRITFATNGTITPTPPCPPSPAISPSPAPARAS